MQYSAMLAIQSQYNSAVYQYEWAKEHGIPQAWADYLYKQIAKREQEARKQMYTVSLGSSYDFRNIDGAFDLGSNSQLNTQFSVHWNKAAYAQKLSGFDAYAFATTIENPQNAWIEGLLMKGDGIVSLDSQMATDLRGFMSEWVTEANHLTVTSNRYMQGKIIETLKN